MEKVEVTHKVEGSVNELIIRQGAAKPPVEPVACKISGNLDSVTRWLENRMQTASRPDPAFSHIQVSRERMEILLREYENYPDGNIISGRLEPHPVFVEFGINKGVYRTTTELAEFFKMKRSFFESHADNMKLVSELRNFKGKVD